ncbi:TPA: hypothetical protein ACH3X2_002457 [Trebouxia sp. C0005]
MFAPADKTLYIRETVDGMLSARHYTKGSWPVWPGCLLSIVSGPAVSMAPLYLRKLYQFTGRNMIEDTDTATLAREDLQYWHDNLDLTDGKSWLKRISLIHVCGDASEVGCGSFMPNGELDAAMVVFFDPAKMQLMSVNKLSLWFCEVKNVRLAVETVVHKLRSEIVGSRMILHTGDCLPAIQMGGTIRIFPEGRQL